MTQALYQETALQEAKFLEHGKCRLNVSRVLKILGVSRSVYNAWKNRKPLAGQLRKQKIKDKIIGIYDDSFQNYGAPKITKVLNDRGEKISEKTDSNYMHEPGIKAQYIKPYTVTTINSDFSSTLKNILDEQFNPDGPDAVWVSDITYIWTHKGFVYLTSVMDLYSRKIISWVLSETLEAKWVVEAVGKAKIRREVSKPLIMHSDRGIQYVSKDYIACTEGMVRSYSKKAYPWDNACIESFSFINKKRMA